MMTVVSVWWFVAFLFLVVAFSPVALVMMTVMVMLLCSHAGLASEAGPSTPSSSSRAGSSFQPVLPPGAEKGIMDSMVKELQDGSVFKNRRTKAFGGLCD